MMPFHIMDGATSVATCAFPPPLDAGQVAVEVPTPASDWLPVPDGEGGYTVEAAARDLEAERASKLDAISARFAIEVTRGCASPKGWVDCDDKAGDRVLKMIQMRERATAAGYTLPPTVDWTMYDKSKAPHDDAELNVLGLAIGFGFSAYFSAKQALETLALAAQTPDDLDAVDITENWP